MKCGIAESCFRRFRAAVVKVNIIFPGESHAAVNLNAAIADGAGGVTRIHFGDGNGLGCVRRIFFERPSGVVNGGAGALSFQIHVRALVLDGLEHADGLAELFAGLGVFDGESRVRCMPPTNSADSAAVVMSRAPGRFDVVPSSSAEVLLNSIAWSLRVRSMRPWGIFSPRWLWRSTTKTPLRATTMMKSATAASGTKYFSPVSFPPLALSCMSLRIPACAGFRDRDGGTRTSPRQMGARYFLLCAGLATASKTDPARITVEKNGPGSSARPASSISSISSTLPRPTPPYASGKMMPV